MAKWQDFMNAIRQSNDDRRKQAQPAPGNFATRSGTAVRDFTDVLAHNFQTNTAPVVQRVRQVNKDVTTGTPGKVVSGVGNFVQDAAQGAVRGVVGLSKSVAEEGDQRSDRLNEMLKMSQQERERLADQGDDPNNTDSRAIFMSKARESLKGDLSDKALKDRLKKIDTEKNTDEHVTNPVAKFFLGGEDNEGIQTAQKRNKDIKATAEQHGITGVAAGALGVAGAAGLTALDAPTGAGGIVKTIGKDGLAQLSKATSEDAVRQVLKTRFPSMAEDAIKEVAPRIASITDEKAITGVLKSVGTRTGGLLQKPKDIVAGVIDTAKGLVDDAQPSHGLKTTSGRPVQDSYGEATDELLSHLKSSSQAKKDIVKDSGGTTRNLLNKATEQWRDKLAPEQRFIAEVEKHSGIKLSTEDNPYELHRLSEGAPDAIKKDFDDTIGNVLAESPDLNSVRAIGYARQIISRGERGLTSVTTPERARQMIEEQRQKLGAEGFDKAAAVVDNVQGFVKKKFDDLHKAGIISDQAFEAVNEMGGDYFSKMTVLNKVLTDDKHRELFSAGASSNVTKQSIKRVLAKASGHAEGTNLLDPLESLMRSHETTMRLIDKNNQWQAYNRLADVAPDAIIRVRDPEAEIAKIGLKSDLKEMIPVRNKLDRVIRVSARHVRQLESQINQLEKKGLNLSLKNGGERMDSAPFSVEGLGGRVPTSQAGKNVVTTPAEKRIIKSLGEQLPVNPTMMGPSDTGSFVRNLIERGSRSDIDRIKKMVGTRDAKMTALLDQIGELKSQYDDTITHIKDHRNEIDSLKDTPVPEGYELISGFDKGMQGKLAVPKEVADVFTGKTKAQRDAFTGIFGGVNSFVKSAFTSNNPAFALITNPLRDVGTFKYTAKNVSANPVKIGQALVGGLVSRLKQDEMYQRMVAAGGKSGFYSNDKSIDDRLNDLKRIVGGKRVLGVAVDPIKSPADILHAAGRVVTAPLRALHGAGSVLEDATRLAQFKATVKAGKSDAEAALDARNVSTDFNRSGTAGQIANAYVPFLNARLQGTLNSVEAVKRNPARSAAVYATLTAAPILAAELNNHRFQDVMDTIPNDVRDNNFVIVFGDGKDEDGHYNEVHTIPKSDVDKILGGPLEQFARFWANDDPDTLAETVTKMLGNVLPIDTVKDGAFNASRAVGSILPPLIKAPAEAIANHSFYNDAPIVSDALSDLPENEQVKDTTSSVGKISGAITGTSPLKAENTIRDFSGSLVTQSPLKTISGKLTTHSDSKMANEFYNIKNKADPIKASTSKKINEAVAEGDIAGARQLAQQYNSYLDEQFADFGERYGDKITPELDAIYDKQKITLSSRSIKQRRRNQIAKQSVQ